MGKYDHPSSGDLEHLKFLFNAPDRPDFLWDTEDPNTYDLSELGDARTYIEWLEWQLDSQAAHNRITGDSKAYYIAENIALKAHLKKMTEVEIDGRTRL